MKERSRRAFVLWMQTMTGSWTLAGQGGDGAGASLFKSCLGKRWTNGIVPFTIDADVPGPERIRDAMAAWEGGTPVRFVPRTTQADFLRVRRTVGRDQDCGYSWVGMIGGEQELSVIDSCGFGEALHEVGHALGLRCVSPTIMRIKRGPRSSSASNNRAETV